MRRIPWSMTVIERTYMATYTVKLLAKEPVAQGTMAFHLERPAGFEFRAGQAFVELFVKDDGLRAGLSRATHTHRSAPR